MDIYAGINKRVHAIIFSRDRAMQLDTTLHSFFLHCRDAEQVSLNVIYLASDPHHEQHYLALAQNYPDVRFIRQGSFREDVFNILLPSTLSAGRRRLYRLISNAANLKFEHGLMQRVWRRFFLTLISPALYRVAPSPREDGFILFLVDDNLFVRDFHLANVLSSLHSHPDALGFSLRLGKNTTYSYMLHSDQRLPAFEDGGGGTLIYRWPPEQHDFNYPLEVSSSVYRLEQIMPLLAAIPFRNPNTLEGEMASRSLWFARKFPRLLCYETSVTFCNPVNVVQNVALGNQAGSVYFYSIDELSERFENGERVDVAAYSGFVPNGCHQEVPLQFKKS